MQVNLHSDAPFPSLLERLSGQYGPGFDPKLPLGSKVQEACLNYRSVLSSRSMLKGFLTAGCCIFTVEQSEGSERQMWAFRL